MNKVLRGDYNTPPNTQPKSIPQKPMPKQTMPKPVVIKKSGRGK
jgi:hypothetical protein